MNDSSKQEPFIYHILFKIVYYKYYVILYSLAIVHILIFFLFLDLDVVPMAVFNVFSVLIYLIFAIMIRWHREKMLIAFYAAYAEILLHAYAATFYIGWQYGFTLYIIALIPFCFNMCYNLLNGRKRYLAAFFLSLFAFLNFIFCRVFMMFWSPVYALELSARSEFFIYIFNSVGTFIFMISLSLIYIVDIYLTTSRLNMQNKLLERLANTDPLTGLYNRRSMQVFLNHAMESGTEFGLAMCDIDDFKIVNDTYGHDAGDIVLKDIAAIIRQITDGYGYVCRWGGEEILILINAGTVQTKLMLEKIRRNIFNHFFISDEKIIRCSITIGLAMHKKEESLEDTIGYADYNLYCGKRNGKNKVVA